MVGSRHRGRRGEPSAKHAGTAPAGADLADQLGRLARSFEAEDDPDQLLADVVAAAVDLIPGAEAGSISVVLGRRDVSSQHPSSELPERVEALQAEVGEGPCLDAVFRQQTVRAPDLATEERWPRFAQRAAELGAASMLSFQLHVAGDNLGALNLYSRRPHAFDDDSEHTGLLFAAHASVAFADSRKIQHLHHSVARRDLIGQAKGILMERYDLSADHAFAALVRVSQHHNRKLYDVAEELTRTRTLPGLVRPQ